ncbi:manganese/divalent cation transport protein [Pseudoalteromonas sp. BSi20311]|jgi:NRAMP (natural resistance-associated macrophage protein)-like metal ion transporter|uniref:Nramp family divalent metal transporter n=1 Tax=Pseudoalteromonas sp. BSi20311 TaxID=383911 RepID=UPI00023191C7|nr:Nramp family divalent metal transporter [Pseudoalteromonas sp. BSi20311]GAA63072.1 manganese/divalent cation transport protein [Pseudoalteromonas sp. BSi20311]HCP98670.1 divalent metal cation transporter [Pseudoalteromonas sp.]|tara:strand:- start:1994 stop:3193 length:1200 start_codon:yes stop_codon:yes gene_type:complete
MRLGPGLLVTAAFIGPGTITTASVAGANFGFALIWTLLFSVIATILLQSMAARLGVATGQDLAQALRAHIETPLFKSLAIFLVISAIGVGSAAYEAGNLSGASMGLIEIFPQVNAQLWTPLIAFLSAILLYSGKHKVVENALILLVILMSLVFISTLVMAAPSLSDVLAGFIPSMPEGSVTTVLALVGTTIVPYNLFLHSGVLAARHDSESDKQKVIKETNIDTGVSITLGGVITLAILSTASVAFYGTDAGQISAANMAVQLEPLLGDAAHYFFAIGLFAAGLTSAITAPLAGAYAVCGMLGWSNKMDNVRFKSVAIVILLFGAAVASLGLDPVAVIIFAQAANGLLLPIVTAYLVWLVNQKTVMGKYTNSVLVNLLTLPVLVLIFGLSSYKLFSLIF